MPGLSPEEMREVVLRITPNVEQFSRGMRQMEEAAKRAGYAMLGLKKQILRLNDPRVQHGLGNFAGDGSWFSDLCSAWVHESCPLPFRCDCRCHA